MKSFSSPEAKDLYYQIKSQVGSYYEAEVIRGINTYGMDRIKSLEIIPALFQQTGPQIGGVNSAQCEVTLLEENENWPRMAFFSVRIRISSADETSKSEWISMGSYYTDERHNDESGNLVIVAYDGMMRLEQSWTDKVQNLPEVWPVTSRKAAEMICEATGIEIEEIGYIDNITPYIGLDTTSTARDVMKSIAVGNGGNWLVTESGKYRLNILENKQVGSSAIAGIAVVGRAIVGVRGDEDWLSDLGMEVASLNISDSEPMVTGVEIQSSNGTIAFQGDRSGYVVKASCDFADTRIAELCLGRMIGYKYSPFHATNARLDPCADVGDYVLVNNEMYPIVTLKWNITKSITADISAPFEKEVVHEYMVTSESARTLRRAVGYTDQQIESTRSYIEQTETSIRQGVAATYISNDQLSDKLSDYSPTSQIENKYYSKEDTDDKLAALSEVYLTDSDLTIAMTEFRGEVDGEIKEITNYIRYEDGVVTVGKLGDPTSVQISNEKISLCYENEDVSYWDKNKQYTPKELQIPAGGKFILGNVLFQPRTSENLSLMWVGE